MIYPSESLEKFFVYVKNTETGFLEEFEEMDGIKWEYNFNFQDRDYIKKKSEKIKPKKTYTYKDSNPSVEFLRKQRHTYVNKHTWLNLAENLIKNNGIARARDVVETATKEFGMRPVTVRGLSHWMNQDKRFVKVRKDHRYGNIYGLETPTNSCEKSYETPDDSR